MSNSADNNAKVIFDAGAALASFPKVDGVPVAILPEHFAVSSLENHMAAPRRKRATVVVHDAPSFVSYVNDHKDEDTRIYLSITDKIGSFVCILDHHHAVADQTQARWGDHRVCYAPRTTVEWQRWQKMDRQKMTQVQFAEFLEENSRQIVTPEAIKVIELALDFQAHTNVEFASAIRQANGNVILRYQETTEAKSIPGQMEVPSELVLGITLFEGGEAYELRARLRYRLEHQKVLFWYELVNPHLIVADAFKATRAFIAEKTEVEILLGEAPHYPADV